MAATALTFAPSGDALAAARRTAATRAPASLTLTATVRNRAGKAYYKRVIRLATLERADVRVLRRSTSSVTVESRDEGAVGPRVTLTARIVPGVPDVLREARTIVPDAEVFGVVTGAERKSAPTDPTVPVVLSAFRIGTTTYGPNERFGVDDVAVAQLRSQYGELRQALVELRVTGYTNKGTNSFHLPPGVAEAVRAFG